MKKAGVQVSESGPVGNSNPFSVFGRYFDRVLLLSATAWVGALWIVGFMVVPLLFAMIPERALAGKIAGVLFERVGWTGLLCGSLLLFLAWRALGARFVRTPVVWVLMLMTLCAVAMQLGIQPMMAQMKLDALPAEVMDSAYAARFAFWHRASSLLYVAQSVLGVVLVAGLPALLSSASGGQQCAIRPEN